MCSRRSAASFSKMSRQDFLKLGGMGITGAALLGITGSGPVLARTDARLASEAGEASREHGVPAGLLLAMGYVNTRLEMPPPELTDFERGELEGRGQYGFMQLTRNPSRNTLGRAARLTGLSEGEIKTNRAANILGGAAVLADIQGSTRPETAEGWQEAVGEYGGTPKYAVEVYEALRAGFSETPSTGERVKVRGRGVSVPRLLQAQAAADYRGAVWYGADPSNYSRSDRERSYDINKVVIHVVEGSLSSCLYWFNDPVADASAHYVVARGGEIAQCVREKDIAWHAGNWPYNTSSIGIEHAGWSYKPETWSPELMNSSARLTAHLCKKYRIPIDRRHIILHREVPGVTKTCPGYHFDPQRYMRLVRNYAGLFYRDVVDNTSPRFSASGHWGVSSWSNQRYGKNYRYARPKRPNDPARFRVRIPRNGRYALYARWPAHRGYNNRAAFYVSTAAGWRRTIVNQRTNGGRWTLLGTYDMRAGDRYVVLHSATSGTGFIIADAVLVREV